MACQEAAAEPEHWFGKPAGTLLSAFVPNVGTPADKPRHPSRRHGLP
jgi:hypothetical protein